VATVSNAETAAAWKTVDPADLAWLKLIERCPDALPFHRPEWLSVLEKSYGFRSFVLGVSDASGALEAGLPFLEVEDAFRGRRWVALPFTDRCPPLASSTGARERLAATVDKARCMGAAKRLDIRSMVVGPGLAHAVAAVTHVLEVKAGYEALERSFSSATRRNLRKAQREGLEVRVADDEDDVIRVFYELQVRTRRRLGVPVQPRRFFRALWRHGLERGLGHALLVLHRGRPIAAGVFLVCGRNVVYKYGASDERYWNLRPNNLLLAEAIRRACEQDATIFDFGRTDLEDSGLRAFKASWGASEQPLVYSSTGRQSAAPRDSAPSTSAARLGSAVLRRLPLWAGRALGAALYRYAA
jgi:CelD/BcsL family acetyltransferase involved in cellulose biosynthesis